MKPSFSFLLLALHLADAILALLPVVDYHYEKKRPLITAHRGSMWYLPEHTVAAYYYAFFEGADFIDIDLQPTADGSFIAYHDNVITPSDIPDILEHPEIFT